MLVIGACNDSDANYQLPIANYSIMNRLFTFLLLLLLIGAGPTAVYSQDNENGDLPAESESTIPRLHVVQSGETLTSIALLYDTSVEALQRLNNISDPSLLYVGQELLIPGGGGAEIITQLTIQAGDTLAGLAAAYHTTEADLIAANRLMNPHHLVAGQSLVVVSRTGSENPDVVAGRPHLTQTGETPLMLAVRYNLSLAELTAVNELPWPPRLYPGQRLRLPDERPYQFLSGEWTRVTISPLPLAQGETVSVYVESLAEGLPTGYLAGRPLRFTPRDEGYVALVGLDAFTPPGAYELQLEGGGTRPWRPFQQPVAVVSANYGTQMVVVPPELATLLEPEVRANEDAFLRPIYSQFTAEQKWDGLFQMPVGEPIITAGYGIGRAYNGGAYDIYHTGIDFAAPVGTLVFASANGEVVFSDDLELRGKTIIINHGLGVMTGYFHLERSLVEVGQEVAAGEMIGEIGSTGLSSGPHLHWDVRLMDVPVNGLQWTRRPFP
jgi:murein DD-endopeptidase MepM/ murein hydrolase activator NlpD